MPTTLHAALDGIEQVFDAGTMGAAEALEELKERVRPVALAQQQRLPVLPGLADLLPGAGLRRGSTVSISAVPQMGGATTLALALLAEASRAGSWVAAVGLPSLGLVAADELGVALERLVLVAAPERDGWGSVVAALIDGFDLVVLHAGRGGVRPTDARRLVARGRERGSVLVQLGAGWAGEADLALQVTAARWEGLGEGHGHLRARRVTVTSGGRGEAARPRQVDLWLPSSEGTVAPVYEPLAARPAAEPVRPLRAVS
ncbi:MAG: hypothetical protein Q8K58_07625 [Acidimicrobiales bacterium]|nr:hypothetical protein [Acidimicrobiales bacterium]